MGISKIRTPEYDQRFEAIKARIPNPYTARVISRLFKVGIDVTIQDVYEVAKGRQKNFAILQAIENIVAEEEAVASNLHELNAGRNQTKCTTSAPLKPINL